MSLRIEPGGRPLLALLVACTLFSHPAKGDDLAVTWENRGRESLGRRDALELLLSRDLTEADGRITVLIGGTDVSDLLERSPRRLRYRPRIAPLPEGDQEIVVLLASGPTWREISRLKLSIVERRALDRAAVAPKVDLTLKGQLAEGHAPDAAAPPRRTFQDLTGQANLGVELARGPATLAFQMGVQAASRAEDSLRFGQQGANAERVDLAAWAVKLADGPATLEWGSLTIGSSRHLINGFSSRGGRAAFSLGAVTLTISALNGSSIVGWDNFLGLETVRHRVYAGTLGLELVPGAPGTLRVETTLVDGTLLPSGNVNRGFVSDAEKSEGAAVTLASNLFAGRVRVEGGFSRNRFEAPSDPLLEQGDRVVRLAPTWRSAYFVSANVEILKGVLLTPQTPVNLTLAYRRDSVDPQYRSVAVSLLSDQRQDVVEANAGVGPAAIQLSYAWLEDNLADLASILKTKTRRAAAQVALPLGALSGSAPAWWLPQLSWSGNETHQFAANNPTGGGFSPFQLPDQVSLGHTAAVDWTAGPARFGWHLNSSNQDNRQPGRETADFLNTSNVAVLGLSPAPFLDFGLELGWERASAKETGNVDRLRRYQTTLGIRPLAQLTFTANTSHTRSENDAETTSSRTWAVDTQLAWRFEPPRRGAHGLTGQILLRYAFQENRARDTVLNVDSFRKTWAVSSGISLSVF